LKFTALTGSYPITPTYYLNWRSLPSSALIASSMVFYSDNSEMYFAG